MQPLFLRTEEMDSRYRKERSECGPNYDPFEERREEAIRSWRYWLLLENIYPYDAVAEVHHLLVADRKFGHPSDMTPAEKEELENIKLELRSEYHAFLENFPSNQSVPSRLHYHFLVWKKRQP